MKGDKNKEKEIKNKKIKNANKTNFAGVSFKSDIEARIYKTLIEEGITPKYEEMTFTLSKKIRPSVPFFNRLKGLFTLDSRPIQAITYTPDFTFYYNNILIIIEVKGFENDVFPVKKNLFRKHLENLNQDCMFFEIRTKKELLDALKIIKMESKQIQKLRKLIPFLPEKDITIGNKLLESRSWDDLYDLVSSSIKRVEKANAKGSEKYTNIDLDNLYNLQTLISECMPCNLEEEEENEEII